MCVWEYCTILHHIHTLICNAIDISYHVYLAILNMIHLTNQVRQLGSLGCSQAAHVDGLGFLFGAFATPTFAPEPLLRIHGLQGLHGQLGQCWSHIKQIQSGKEPKKKIPKSPRNWTLMEVSQNRGTHGYPESSSILVGFSTMHHPALGVPPLMETLRALARSLLRQAMDRQIGLDVVGQVLQSCAGTWLLDATK